LLGGRLGLLRHHQLAQLGIRGQHTVFGRPLPAQRTGVIDHMAFSARDVKAVKARFEARAIKLDLRRQAGAGIWQLFCFDPNGARVELDFDAAESVD
jgi:hypothetical protein